MDIAGVSMALSNAKIANSVGTAVLGKTMDLNETMGQGLINMIDKASMERSVNPSVGSRFDILV